jgi:hypothetical protein
MQINFADDLAPAITGHNQILLVFVAFFAAIDRILQSKKILQLNFMHILFAKIIRRGS